MGVSKEKMEEIINGLQGTCKSLDEVLSHYEISYYSLSDENFEQLDNAIFCCACCGWWYDTGELSSKIADEQVCTDCEDDY